LVLPFLFKLRLLPPPSYKNNSCYPRFVRSVRRQRQKTPSRLRQSAGRLRTSPCHARIAKSKPCLTQKDSVVPYSNRFGILEYKHTSKQATCSHGELLRRGERRYLDGRSATNGSVKCKLASSGERQSPGRHPQGGAC
jgi:hypothetical protein